MKQDIIEKNKQWFDKNEFYSDFISKNETYKNIKEKLDHEVKGVNCLLDIGNGGCFNYDLSLAGEIYAIDLFFGDTIEDYNGKSIHFIKGSATELPFDNNMFDGIIIVSLLHHLVGNNYSDLNKNIKLCFNECFRVIKPGGKLIIHEPCIPNWFFFLEKKLFGFIKFIVNLFFKHPLAIQLTSNEIEKLVAEKFKVKISQEIPKSGSLIHFGIKFPAAISPVKAYLFTAEKGI